MNSFQQNASFLKIKQKEKKVNKDIGDQNQDIPQIRIIKQHILEQYDNNNIEQLQKATSNLYYAMYQIKEKKNIIMLPFNSLKLQEFNSLIVSIKNLIIDKQQIIKELSEQEKTKYENATQWTQKIIDQQNEFEDLYLQILEVYKQIKKRFLNEQNTYLLVLHQNQNQIYNKFLIAFCFLQNLKLDQNIIESSMQFQDLDDNVNNNTQNLQQLDISQKRNLYLNFSSDIEQTDINFWTFYMQEYKETNKLIILFQNRNDIKLKNNTRNEILIPIINNNQVQIQEYQIQMIYKSRLDQQIKDFKPDCIFFEYQLSDQFYLELDALEYLIRQLKKNAKLIIHFRISFKQEYTEYQLSNNLNAIIMGVQEFKHSVRKFISEDQYSQMVNWTLDMMKFKDNSKQNINLSLQSELQLIQIKVQNLQNNIIGYQLENNTFKWIQHNINTIKAQYLVFKEIIILYDKQSKEIYYANSKQKLQETHFSNSSEKILFSKISFYNQEILEEPSIIKIQDYIIIAYGHTKNKSNNKYEFSDKIWIYDLKNNQQKLMSIIRDEEYQQFRFPYYSKVKNYQDVVNRIKWRRGPQICNNNLFKDPNFISFILIGGETLIQQQTDKQFNPNLIMNIIEVVILNLKNQKFCSFIVNKTSLSKLSSLKPWPYQQILEGSNQDTSFYLVLNGNQTLRQNYYSFPKNPQYLKQAQLLVQSQSQFSLFAISIKSNQDLIIQIDELLDDCKLQYQDGQQSGQNCYVWKLIITRFVFIQYSLINHTLFKPFEMQLKQMQEQGIQFCQIAFQVTVKLNLQINEQKFINQQDSNVEIDYDKIELFSEQLNSK